MYGTASRGVPFAGVADTAERFFVAMGEYLDFHSAVSVEVLLMLMVILAAVCRVLWPLLRAWLLQKRHNLFAFITRDIVFVDAASYRKGNLPTDRNGVLQNAIMLYLTECVWPVGSLPSHVWRHTHSALLLVDPFRSRVYESRESPFFMDWTPSDEEEVEPLEPTAATTIHRREKMDRLVLFRAPQTWMAVSDGIEMRCEFEQVALGSLRCNKRSFFLRARGRDAGQRIGNFCERSVQYLITKLPETKSARRYYYELQPSGAVRGETIWKRYPLVDGKNFDTLFFPEKERVVKHVEDFLLRRSRFAVEGFPYKLGFLLDGPTGVGKTAFVRALATYTGRSIVSVPLHLVETNQQLCDIFFQQTFKCVGESAAETIDPTRVIFLLDNVDASSSVVCARERDHTVRRQKVSTLTARPMAASSEAAQDVNEEQLLRRQEDSGPLGIATMGDQPVDAEVATTSSESVLTKGEAALEHNFEQLLQLFQETDKLNLSGLLNVLDGVVDTPGRIVVMTTYHPEWLDPALVRPGRFSMRLHLDYVQFDALVQMVGLHVGDLEPSPDVTVMSVLDSLYNDRRAYHNRRQEALRQRRNMNHWKATDAVEKQEEMPLKNETRKVPGGHDGLVQPPEDARWSIPHGAAEARLPRRRLSAAQVKELQTCITALEMESDQVAKDEGGGGYRFCITPAEVELICARSNSFEDVLELLTRVIKHTLML